MKASRRPSLKTLNSFGIEATAALLVTLEREEDLLPLPPFDPSRDLILGGGSNLVFASDIPGRVLHNVILGRDVVRSDEDHAWVEAGAGEDWHSLVRWTLEQGLSGLENLSLIPGSAGAAPIQNIGAYGVELASVLDSVTAWDLATGHWKVFSREDCGLGYRDSVFKSGVADRFLITSIRLRLERRYRPQLDYAGLREELTLEHDTAPDAIAVSDAVIRLRQRKLPDPLEFGNAGSFFKNPVLEAADARALTEQFPGLPSWPSGGGGIKLSAAWMIDHCGLRGYRSGGAGVSEQHTLVIVNHGAASGREILEVAETVRSAVSGEFGIGLETEPRIIDFSV